MACVNKVRKIDKRNFTLKSPKSGENKLNANLRAKRLKKSYRFVRIVRSSSKRSVWRVYASSKKRK